MIRCEEAALLVPAYLDGELSEAQAGPLRKHLLDCVGCRGAAQDLKGLKRWFRQPAEVQAVPSGFAARVARRAFAGDLGVEAVPFAPPPPAVVTASAGASPREALPFVRELVALAAGVLVMLAIGLGLDRRPAGETMRAEEALPLNQIQEELDRMNRLEAEAERASTVEGAAGIDGPRAD